MSGIVSVNKVDGVLQRIIGDHQRIVAAVLVVSGLVFLYMAFSKEGFGMPGSTLRKTVAGMSGSENYVSERASNPDKKVQASAHGVDSEGKQVYKNATSKAIMNSPEFACKGRSKPQQDAWAYMTKEARSEGFTGPNLAVNKVSDDQLSQTLMGA